jgi:soluble lytic murein transglycosylase
MPSAYLFFALPLVALAMAIGLRTSGAVESATSIVSRLRVHLPAARAAAGTEKVPVELVLAVAAAESAGRADARSPQGAVGLMQLLSGTASDMAKRGREPEPDRLDPATSLRLGTRYLALQRRRFSDHELSDELALCAYNAGPAKVSRWLKSTPIEPGATSLGSWIPYKETRDYVRRVGAWRVRWAQLLEDEERARGRVSQIPAD